MDYKAEVTRIKEMINNLSNEEFDKLLYDCGIETIGPSIESNYVKCLKRRLAEKEYRKNVQSYSLEDEYFLVEIDGQEVA